MSAPLKMHFFYDAGVGSVPKRRPGQSSRILYTLRFSARYLLTLVEKLLFLEAPLSRREQCR